MPVIPISYTGLGILFSICGNLLISISLNIQKQAHRKHPSKHTNNNGIAADAHVKGPSYIYSLEWWSGFLLMTLGEVGNFIAYGLAPVSIVSPMGVVTIISNSTFIAPVLFHEKIRRRDMIGTFIASCGVIMMILSSIKVEDDGDNSGGNNDNRYMTDPFGYLDSIVVSWNFAIYLTVTSAIVMFLVVRLSRFKRHRSIRYLLYNLCVVALFGSYTAMATKLLSTIIGFSNVSDIFENFRIYVLLVVIVGTSIFQIKYLNKCLKVSDSTTVVPIHFVFFTTSVLIGSAVIFKDFADKSPGSVALFMAGALLTFFGVFCICGGVKNDDNHDASSQHFVTSIPVIEPHQVIAQNDCVSVSGVIPEIIIPDQHDNNMDIVHSSQQSTASSVGYEGDEPDSVYNYSNSKVFANLTAHDNVLHLLQTSKSTPELQLKPSVNMSKLGSSPVSNKGITHSIHETKDQTGESGGSQNHQYIRNTYKNYSSTDIPSEINNSYHNSGTNIQLHVPHSNKNSASERRKSISDIYQAGWDFLPLKDSILSPVNRSKASVMGNGYFAIAGTGNVLMTTIFNTDDTSSIEPELLNHSHSTSSTSLRYGSALPDSGDLV